MEFQGGFQFNLNAVFFAKDAEPAVWLVICLAPELFAGTVDVDGDGTVMQKGQKFFKFCTAKRDPAQLCVGCHVGIVIVFQIGVFVFLHPGEDEFDQFLRKRFKSGHCMEEA